MKEQFLQQCLGCWWCCDRCWTIFIWLVLEKTKREG